MSRFEKALAVETVAATKSHWGRRNFIVVELNQMQSENECFRLELEGHLERTRMEGPCPGKDLLEFRLRPDYVFPGISLTPLNHFPGIPRYPGRTDIVLTTRSWKTHVIAYQLLNKCNAWTLISASNSICTYLHINNVIYCFSSKLEGKISTCTIYMHARSFDTGTVSHLAQSQVCYPSDVIMCQTLLGSWFLERA